MVDQVKLSIMQSEQGSAHISPVLRFLDLQMLTKDNADEYRQFID